MNRRDFLTLPLAAGFSASASLQALTQAAPSFGPNLEVIDCHTHFYDPTRPGGVPWPAKGSSIYRTVLPQHLRALPHHRKVTGTVIVEASPRLEDNQWLLDLAKEDPFVVGIIGNISPEYPDFHAHLRRFNANPLFRGIRVSSKLVQSRLASGDQTPFRQLADAGLILDINGGPETPGWVAQLAAQIPQLQCVINHMGNVPITRELPPKDWTTGMQAAGKQPNVACKLSAFMGAASNRGIPAPQELNFYRPYFEVVWEAFGENRIVYGSDWPNSEPSAKYATQQRLSFEYAASKGSEALPKFAALNAKTIYRWIDRPGRA